MTATTTATATTTVPDVKPLQSKKKSTSSRPFTAAAPPPVDLEGKTVPFSQRWGFSSHVFTNDLIRSSVFDAVVIGSFVAFNASPYAVKTYAYLEENFTPFQINAYGTFAITTLLYWAFAGLFAFVDLTGRPRFLFKYKVQPFARVDARDYAKIAQVVIKNQLVVVLPLILVKGKIFPSAISPSKLQGPWETLGHIFFNVVSFSSSDYIDYDPWLIRNPHSSAPKLVFTSCELLTAFSLPYPSCSPDQVSLYYSHKTFHSPALYATYHKQHHTLTAPVGLGATYCGVAEHLFSNLLPNAIGTTILQPHWSVALFTFCYLEIGTICAHSGYNFPYMHTSLRHDWHHFRSVFVSPALTPSLKRKS